MKNSIAPRYKSADKMHKMRVYNGDSVSVRLLHFRNY
jgi:translation initiation factor IF-1